MGIIDIIDVETLMKDDPKLWALDDRGLLVVCENGQESNNVIEYIRANSIEVSDGLKTKDGRPITIYEESSEPDGVEFVFMLPVHMSVELAIDDVHDQLRPFFHVT
jgi:hypothetical protein